MRRRARARDARTSLGALAALAVLLVAAPSASADQSAPNPSFENVGCGGPCFWATFNGGSVADSSIARTGAHSLAYTAASNSSGAYSNCITAAGSGTYAQSIWYRTTSPVAGISMITTFHFGTDCTGEPEHGIVAKTVSPVADGNWHQLTASRDIVPGAGVYSAEIVLVVDCAPTCPKTVLFDDASLTLLEQAPNPSFENVTCGTPCYWAAFSGSVADSSTARTGAHSLAFTAASDSSAAFSRCVSAAGSGTYAQSIWYRTTSPVASIRMTTTFRFGTFGFGTDCTGEPQKTLVAQTLSPIADGNWHQLTETGEVPAGAGVYSAEIVLAVSCAASCPKTVLFDDASLTLLQQAPNPSFEDVSSCAAPCQWSAANGGSLADSSTAHSGAHSLAYTAASDVSVAYGNCITAAGSGTYAASIWYRPANPVAGITMNTTFFAGTDCTGEPQRAILAQTSTPVADGNWHQLGASDEVPAGAGVYSARIILSVDCARSCPRTVLFDDASLTSPASAPTAASAVRVSAVRTSRGTRISWRTASDVGTLGFNVWRNAPNQRPQRVNRALVPARGGAQGSRYSILDRRVGHRVSYRVEIVGLDGTSSWTR